MTPDLDETDYKILKLLQKNARLGNKEIAAAVGLTVTPVFERIKKMERLGVIERYTVRLNKEKLGKGLHAFCQVTLKAHNLDVLEGFEDAIIRLKEINSCFHIAGTIDYLLSVEVSDMQAYETFLRERLASIPNIAQVQSSFVLRQLKG